VSTSGLCPHNCLENSNDLGDGRRDVDMRLYHPQLDLVCAVRLAWQTPSNDASFRVLGAYGYVSMVL
jgi:hypothetical protein